MNKGHSKSFNRFLLLWFGSFISTIGNGITSFGLSVYVFEQTGLASSTTFITLLAFLPGLILSPLAGVLADKYDRRYLMILGDSLSALGLIFILFYILRGEIYFWQIGLGVSISSIFSSLIEPSFKATITDLLTEEEYSKANGFVQVSNAAKYLISPVLAGFLLTISNIELLLIIDILTIIVTVATTFMVKKKLVSKVIERDKSIYRELKIGISQLINNRGGFALAIIGSCISFFIGCVQSLYTPMILGFSDSSALGIVITLSASGMLVTSIILGLRSITKDFVKVLSTALFLAGIFMVGFGVRENLYVICFFGFLIFSVLPFANASLDYLVRINIDNEIQGRIWSLIGIISQFGYIVAYATLGPLVDYVFTPLLIEGGALSKSVGRIIGVGSSRGIGFLIILSGIMLSLTAIVLYNIKSIRNLEKGRNNHVL